MNKRTDRLRIKWMERDIIRGSLIDLKNGGGKLSGASEYFSSDLRGISTTVITARPPIIIIPL